MASPVISSPMPPRVDLGQRPGADLAAVAQDGDPLGDLDHLVEPVADEHHRDALLP